MVQNSAVTADRKYLSQSGRTPRSVARNLQAGSTSPGAAVAVLPKKHTKAAVIAIIVLLVVGLLGYFIFHTAENSDPLRGTWYVQLSELVGQPIPVTFDKDTVTFGAGVIQNEKDITLRYEEEGNNTLKIYSEQGGDYAECTYQISGDRLYLSSSTESSLNLAFSKHPGQIMVPVN